MARRLESPVAQLILVLVSCPILGAAMVVGAWGAANLFRLVSELVAIQSLSPIPRVFGF